MGLLFGTKLILYTNIGLSVKGAVMVIPLQDFLPSPAVPDLLENACTKEKQPKHFRHFHKFK